MSDIASCRLSLLVLNQQIINLIRQRRNLVQQISSHKKSQELFDIKREIEVFQKLSIDLSPLTLDELFAFSFLMETQVKQWGQYPSWSKGDHLEQASEHLIHKINPVMLKVLKPEEFKNLDLNPNFKK